MGSFRLVRLSEQIRCEIAKMIMSGEIKDPRVSTFLSINRVEISNDLSFAKVYVSSFMSGKKNKAGVAGLQSAAGYIQGILGRKLRYRQFPHLNFIVDSSIQEGMAVIEKLNELKPSAGACGNS